MASGELGSSCWAGRWTLNPRPLLPPRREKGRLRRALWTVVGGRVWRVGIWASVGLGVAEGQEASGSRGRVLALNRR